MITAVRSPCDEGLIRSRPASAPCAPVVGRWVLVVTILGSSMAFIDGSVVNAALLVLQGDLLATVTDLQWIVIVNYCHCYPASNHIEEYSQ